MYEGNRTITIPQFIRAHELWLDEDELRADIELATLITHKVPPDYYVWKDFQNEETAYAYGKALEARSNLKEWADRILA